ncbi:MAG: hypothetical protein GXO63_00380 [Candidatus Micrarchaeota archaeon]|nr:hypothetical protein [Candidatus Micrarchaeota archaeon]
MVGFIIRKIKEEIRKERLKEYIRHGLNSYFTGDIKKYWKENVNPEDLFSKITLDAMEESVKEELTNPERVGKYIQVITITDFMRSDHIRKEVDYSKNELKNVCKTKRDYIRKVDELYKVLDFHAEVDKRIEELAAEKCKDESINVVEEFKENIDEKFVKLVEESREGTSMLITHQMVKSIKETYRDNKFLRGLNLMLLADEAECVRIINNEVVAPYYASLL